MTIEMLKGLRESQRDMLRTGKLPGRGNHLARFVDRYAGIALVFALGTVRRKRLVPKWPERIGLLNTAAVGDTVLMSGPAADLRAGYQGAELVFFSGPSNYETACLFESVDRVVKLPVFDPLESLRILREQDLDILLDFGPWCRLNALFTILSTAGFVVGFRTPGEGRHFGYDLAVEHSNDVHELENHRRIVEALGIPAFHRPSLRLSQVEERLRKFDLGDPYLVFHLWPGGSAAREKEWPTDRWVALAEYFAASEYRIVLTGAPNQRDLNEAVIARINPGHRKHVCNAAGISLRETLGLLAGAELVVSVDTGVMHMAAVLDVPLVALYGPTNPMRWGPLSEKAHVVQSPLTASGYLNLGFENPRNPPPCMEAICFESVQNACDAALGRLEYRQLRRASAFRG